MGRSIPRERIYSLCQKRIQISENSFLGFFGEQGEAQNFSTQNFVHFGWFRGTNDGKVYLENANNIICYDRTRTSLFFSRSSFSPPFRHGYELIILRRFKCIDFVELYLDFV